MVSAKIDGVQFKKFGTLAVHVGKVDRNGKVFETQNVEEDIRELRFFGDQG